MTTVENPLQGIDIKKFYERFRDGKISSEEITKAYLERIKVLDKKLCAFEYIDEKQAIRTAKAMDQLRAAGVDLGPLMGLPISVKDLFTVQGMPTTVGTNIDVKDLIDPEEGPFIKAIRRSGCIILGKTRMVEFSLGITGVSSPRGTPWNPCDMKAHRLPGGSSSGAGVSVAAGLCALAIGTDSGGSVRVPASHCGVFGLKTTFGRWPKTGAFPLLEEVDSIGIITRTARDAALAYSQISKQLNINLNNKKDKKPCQLRLGKVKNYFYDGLSPIVEKTIGTALETLSSAGIKIEPLEVPQVKEREEYFPTAMPASLVEILGKERIISNIKKMDPVIASRITTGFEPSASDYLFLERRRVLSCKKIEPLFRGFDAWISPTTTEVAPLLKELKDPEKGLELALGMTRNTQPANYFGICAASLPVKISDTSLPVGLQIMCPAGQDEEMLSVAIIIEGILEESLKK